MAKWQMREQVQIDQVLSERNDPFTSLAYERSERGEYMVTAERRGQPGRIVLGIHKDRRTAYKEALQYMNEEA
jgi:hypothetical protein